MSDNATGDIAVRLVLVQSLLVTAGRYREAGAWRSPWSDAMVYDRMREHQADGEIDDADAAFTAYLTSGTYISYDDEHGYTSQHMLDEIRDWLSDHGYIDRDEEEDDDAVQG